MTLIKQSFYISVSLLVLLSSSWAMKTPEEGEGGRSNTTFSHPPQQTNSQRGTGSEGFVPHRVRIPSGWFGSPPDQETSLPIPSLPQTHAFLFENSGRNTTTQNTSGGVGRTQEGENIGPTPSSSQRPVRPEGAAEDPEASLRRELLQDLGIEDTPDTQASYFLTERELYDRIANNFHGPLLTLDKLALDLNLHSLVIFDALAHAKSVKEFSLKETQLSDTHYVALTNALARNQSLKTLNLTQAFFSETAFTLLGIALKNQKYLRELILRPQFTFTEAHVEKFYNDIKSNTGLSFIIWPDDAKLIKKIKALADKGNRVAALHYGMLYAVKSMPQDIKEGMKYLQKAFEQGHPLASYMIGRIKEKQKDFPEAKKWYEIAANNGQSQALVKMGDYHRAIWPKGTTQEPNYQKAHQLYKIAADQEHGKALYRIGRMYEAGRHEEKSLPVAGYHFFLACERGYPDAFTALGALYNNPEYSEHDSQASKYYIEWGKRFKKTKSTAERLLRYINS